MTDLPSGTVTFLFTDIEGSTRLLSELGTARITALDDHRRLVRDAIAEHGGVEVDTQGDAFFVAFARAGDAVRPAIEIQRAMAAMPGRMDRPMRVRIGLHTTEARVGAEGYVGIGVHRGARIGAAAHGGQIVMSSVTAALAGEEGFGQRSSISASIGSRTSPRPSASSRRPGKVCQIASRRCGHSITARRTCRPNRRRSSDGNERSASWAPCCAGVTFGS